MAATQLSFGQPYVLAGFGSGTPIWSGEVLTPNVNLPLRVTSAPPKVSSAVMTIPGKLIPGAVLPPLLVHVTIGTAFACNSMTPSALPRPKASPVPVSDGPVQSAGKQV